MASSANVRIDKISPGLQYHVEVEASPPVYGAIASHARNSSGCRYGPKLTLLSELACERIKACLMWLLQHVTIDHGILHTSSSASCPLLTLSQRHSGKIYSSSRRIQPLHGDGKVVRGFNQTWQFSGLYGCNALRGFSVARSVSFLLLSTHPFDSLYIRNREKRY